MPIKPNLHVSSKYTSILSRCWNDDLHRVNMLKKKGVESMWKCMSIHFIPYKNIS